MRSSASLRTLVTAPDKTLDERLREWLGPEGIVFFSGLMQEHGTLLAILKVPLSEGRWIPWSVHFREGMTVRNWLRGQPETKDWDYDKLSDEWENVVKKALDLKDPG